MSASPPSIQPAMIPRFPPAWAEVFGEDNAGIFAECTLREIRFVWRWIVPGRFKMGSPDSEAGRFSDQGPQHEVTISRGFWLGETPITQAQWAAVMGENPSQFRGEQRPVEQVSWHDTIAFAARLNHEFPGLFVALPTEAQWEYACRAGTRGAFHINGSKCTQLNGKDPVLDELGWFDKNSGGETKDVRLKRPNAWGLYDMHGNVWEWCRDAWDQGAYQSRASGVVNPENRSSEESAPRVVRGGSWDYPARFCRAAFRYRYGPGYRWLSQGFRLSAGQEPGAAEPLGAERPPGPARRSRG